MGPTKVVIKEHALYDAKTGKLIKEGLSTLEEMDDYATHHYLALPVVDQTGRLWDVNGQPVYCLHGVRYETLDDEAIHVMPCPDCGGMAIRANEPSVQSECVRCTQCGHEFDTKLEMMES